MSPTEALSRIWKLAELTGAALEHVKLTGEGQMRRGDGRFGPEIARESRLAAGLPLPVELTRRRSRVRLISYGNKAIAYSQPYFVPRVVISTKYCAILWASGGLVNAWANHTSSAPR